VSTWVSSPQRHRGERLGLPATGPGSLVRYGVRFGALLVDCVASGLVAALFVQRRDAHGLAERLPGSWSLIPLAVDYVVGLLLGGQTLGMHLVGIRVVRVDRPTRITPFAAVLRTAMLFALVPAVIVDRDGRGLHDRLIGTAVVRTGNDQGMVA
jgi:uncharacterized RDD family membrane protein YckC